MQIKKELRTKLKQERKELADKANKDILISNKLFSLEQYKNSKTVFCYASLDDEINTDGIMLRVLKDGKRLALAYCRDNKGNMDFYYISSLSQLKCGSFNVREPDVNVCEKAVGFIDAIVIVPGLCFDKKGNRLGYGKGFYDRFLERFDNNSVGLCYDEMLINEVPADKYDKKVDIIVTQSSIIICNNGGKNG